MHRSVLRCLHTIRRSLSQRVVGWRAPPSDRCSRGQALCGRSAVPHLRRSSMGGGAGRSPSYRENVLEAFQQVEDNLAALRLLDQELATQQVAVASARRSVDLSTARYKRGITTYLEVLTAQSIALSDERTAADLMTRRMTASVQLVKALGGGWDRTQLPKM